MARFVGASRTAHPRARASLTVGREAGANPPHVARAPTAVPADACVVAVRWTALCAFSMISAGLRLVTMREGRGKAEAAVVLWHEARQVCTPVHPASMGEPSEGAGGHSAKPSTLLPS